jgi:putative GTP pyrophosphokinase
MPFSLVPKESKNQIRRAGEILCSKESTPEEKEWALDLANRWRACHAYPINTFQSTLRDNVRSFGSNVIVAQRLKRMPTIIEKLKIYPHMNLTTMQDIGGVRAVLGSISNVNQLVKIYKSKSRFRHELINESDYIQNPRNEDGYRSIHLIYKYHNLRNPNYDGLRIELQIRTRLQHTWATAVETMGTFLGQALKSRQGDREWINYFAIISSAFALMEGTPPIPRFREANKQDIYQEVLQTTRNLGAIEIIRGFSTSMYLITAQKKPEKVSYFYLIVLKSLKKQVEIYTFGKGSIEVALEKYSDFEKRAAAGEPIEPVLVSAGSLRTLKRAYPNFFLDMSEFLRHIEKIVNQNGKN